MESVYWPEYWRPLGFWDKKCCSWEIISTLVQALKLDAAKKASQMWERKCVVPVWGISMQATDDGVDTMKCWSFGSVGHIKSKEQR